MISAQRAYGARFWRVWTASTVSTLGDGVRYVAFPLIAAALTRDPRSIALVAAVGFLPWLLFGLVGGALADRFDRRVLMWTIDVGRAAVVGALAVATASGHVSIVALGAVTFLLGTAETVFDNAASAMVPSVVADEHLEAANSWLLASQTAMSTFVGAPLGGILFAAGWAVPLTFDAVSFLVAAMIVLRLSGRYLERAPQASSSIRADVGEGLRWLWHSPTLRTLCLLLCVMNATFAAAEAVLVLYALDVLDLSTLGFGLLLVMFAVGGLIGSAIAARLARRFGGRTLVVVAVLSQGGALAVLGTTSSVPVAGAMLIVVGATSLLWNVPTMSLRQRIVPPALLGRVTSAYRVVGLGMMPVGAAAAGVLARHFGLHAPYLAGAVLVAISAAVFLPMLRWPDPVDRSTAPAARAGAHRLENATVRSDQNVSGGR